MNVTFYYASEKNRNTLTLIYDNIPIFADVTGKQRKIIVTIARVSQASPARNYIHFLSEVLTCPKSPFVFSPYTVALPGVDLEFLTFASRQRDLVIRHSSQLQN